MIPIWFCLVKTEQLTPTGILAYKIVAAIPTTLEEVGRLHNEYAETIYTVPGLQTMYFTREPEPNPVRQAHKIEQSVWEM